MSSVPNPRHRSNRQWATTEANQKNHGVRFADAVSAFSDERALTLDDPHAEEERYVTMGMDALARLLVVVYTWRGGSFA